MSGGLRVERLGVSRDGRAVLDVDSLEVAAGDLAVVTGDAGSGKSTLAAALAGAVAATGTVTVNGRRLAGPPSRRRRHGLAVAVGDGRRLAGCTTEEALRLAGRGRAAAALERFPLLRARAGVAAELLSGGEQQLLQLLCAWCAEPRVLVLDAPATGLAAGVAAAVAELAREEASRGCAVLWLDAATAGLPAPARQTLVSGRLVAAAAS